MIDTHAHLNFPELGEDIDHILHACTRAGIAGIVVPGTDLENSQTAIECAMRYKQVFAAVGIHPLRVLEMSVGETEAVMGEFEAWVEELEALAHQSQKVVAVGEIGLDYYHIKRAHGALRQDYVDAQHALFTAQLALAKRLGVAVIIHSRDSAEALLDILREHWVPEWTNKVVIHCCEADERILEFAIERGVYIGVDGDVTFIKKKQRFIQHVPLERLVLETDSPFLTPSPIREEKPFPNSPEYLKHVRDAVAELHNVTPDMVSRVTTANARTLFGLEGVMLQP